MFTFKRSYATELSALDLARTTTENVGPVAGDYIADGAFWPPEIG